MDSGNSGSMQSSSGGGDEEYDSRPEPFSAFLNSSAQISGPMLSLPPPSSQQHPHLHSSLFDPLSNYLEAFPRSPPPPSALNSISNLDMGWPRGPRSDPNTTNIAALVPPSSSSTPHLPGPMASNRIPYNPLNPSMPMPSVNSDNNNNHNGAIDQPNPSRNPKKRSRASRRAPTTVLTTDTSNFRAMVQEFTGIPAPPFSASTFPRSRLDLFTSPSTMRIGLSDPTTPYLLRPFVQKVPQHPPFPSIPLGSSSSSLTSSSSTAPDAVASSTSTATNSINAFGNATASSSTSVAATNTYPLLSDLGIPKQNQSLPNINMNNPIFTFQSPPKYQLANLAAFGSKSIGSTSLFQPALNADPQLRVGTLDGFSMSHGHVSSQQGSLSSFIASEGISSRSVDPPRWGTEGAGLSNEDQEQLRPFNGNHGSSQQRVSSCKLNYNASSSSDFNAEKGPDNVQPRGEGMVDSWICSSD